MINEDIKRPGTMFLIDTSTWIFVLKPTLHVEAKNYVYELIKNDLIVTLPLIIFEILSGAKNSKEYNDLKNKFEALHQLDIEQKLWAKIYETGFKLRRKGITVPLVDLVIAVTASHYNCVLLHHDRHYRLLGESGIIRLQEKALPKLC